MSAHRVKQHTSQTVRVVSKVPEFRHFLRENLKSHIIKKDVRIGYRGVIYLEVARLKFNSVHFIGPSNSVTNMNFCNDYRVLNENI